MGNKKLIIANWKCNPASQKEAEYIFKVVKKGILDFGLRKNTEIVICPPYVFLSSIKHQ
ncbi:triose-phosphate isomerase, partial [bacterium]|nr:triose-phosphate isomerase [bacterium]